MMMIEDGAEDGREPESDVARMLSEICVGEHAENTIEAILALVPDTNETARSSIRGLIERLADVAEERTDLAIKAHQELHRSMQVQRRVLEDLTREQRRAKNLDTQMDLMSAQRDWRDERNADQRKLLLREVSELRQQLWRALHGQADATMIMGLDASGEEEAAERDKEIAAMRAMEQQKRDHQVQLQQFEAAAADLQATAARRQRETDIRLREEADRHARELSAISQKHRHQLAQAERLQQERSDRMSAQIGQLREELRRSEGQTMEAEQRVANREDIIRARAEELQDVQRQRRILKSIVHRLQEKGEAASSEVFSESMNMMSIEAERSAHHVSSNMDEDATRQINELRDQVQDRNTRLQTTQAELARMQTEREKLQDDNRVLRKKSVVLEEALSQAQRQTGASPVLSPRSAPEIDVDEVAKLSAELRDRTHEAQRLKKELDIAQSTVRTLRADVSALITRIKGSNIDREIGVIAARSRNTFVQSASPRPKSPNDELVAGIMTEMRRRKNALSAQVSLVQGLLANCVVLRERANRQLARMRQKADDGDAGDLAEMLASNWASEATDDELVTAEEVECIAADAQSVREELAVLLGVGEVLPPCAREARAVRVGLDEAAGTSVRRWAAGEQGRFKTTGLWVQAVMHSGVCKTRALSKSLWRLAVLGVKTALRCESSDLSSQSGLWWRSAGLAGGILFPSDGSAPVCLRSRSLPVWRSHLRLQCARASVREARRRQVVWAVESVQGLVSVVRSHGTGCPLLLWQNVSHPVSPASPINQEPRPPPFSSKASGLKRRPTHGSGFGISVAQSPSFRQSKGLDVQSVPGRHSSFRNQSLSRKTSVVKSPRASPSSFRRKASVREGEGTAAELKEE
eukprot:Hpha_TRINITY_DN15635_c2_g2::TRINITY_DN15635_c2_g2_i1::g.101877::m.101877